MRIVETGMRDVGATAQVALGALARGDRHDPLDMGWRARSRATDAHRCEWCPVRSLSICASLERDTVGEIAEASTRALYSPRDTIFEEGDPCGDVHIVTSGVVRLHRDLPDGRRFVLGFALPGDLLGVSMEGRRAVTAQALDAVAVCRVSRAAFEKLAERRPALLRRLYEEATHELTLAQEQMVLLGRRNAREKTAAFLIGFRNRWKRVNGRASHVALAMTREDIGDYLGLTIETVSRTISAFARERLLMIVPDGIRILDAERLEEAAG